MYFLKNCLCNSMIFEFCLPKCENDWPLNISESYVNVSSAGYSRTHLLQDECTVKTEMRITYVTRTQFLLDYDATYRPMVYLSLNCARLLQEGVSVVDGRPQTHASCASN